MVGYSQAVIRVSNELLPQTAALLFVGERRIARHIITFFCFLPRHASVTFP